MLPAEELPLRVFAHMEKRDRAIWFGIVVEVAVHEENVPGPSRENTRPTKCVVPENAGFESDPSTSRQSGDANRAVVNNGIPDLKAFDA